ncbi:MAG TPA: STAS domain-containing protein [Gemmatimonadaceae bacterium]|nr:STAS domain-containing protein [Gemmatimonadaceae bacterium]
MPTALAVGALLDARGSRALVERLSAELAADALHGRLLTLDLQQAERVHSAALQTLVAVARACRGGGGHLELTGVSEPVRRAIALGGLAAELPCTVSESEACEAAA